MSEQTKTIVIGLIFVLIMCVGSYIAGRVKGREIGWNRGYTEGYAAGYAAQHPADTVIVRDTLQVDHPTVVVKWRDRVELLPVRDTVRVTDSLYIAVPIETKVYADSTYRAQVSGWEPSLDWIEVYQKTQTITQYIDHPAPRWSFGVTGGLGVVWSDGMRIGPGIMAGLQYRF